MISRLCGFLRREVEPDGLGNAVVKLEVWTFYKP
jgi:hypothetical protein